MILTFIELQVEGSTARAEEEDDDSFSSFMVWKGEESKTMSNLDVKSPHLLLHS